MSKLVRSSEFGVKNTHNTEHITHNQKGVSLIESLLVVVIIGSIVFLIASIPNALMLISKSRHLSLAREIVVKQIEDKRTISYANLANGSSAIADSRLGLLPQGSGTVVIADCNLELCTNEEHIKQITVTVNWSDNNKPQTITLDTMIGEGGIDQ